MVRHAKPAGPARRLLVAPIPHGFWYLSPIRGDRICEPFCNLDFFASFLPLAAMDSLRKAKKASEAHPAHLELLVPPEP